MSLEQQIKKALTTFEQLPREEKRAMILKTLDEVRQNPVDSHGPFPVWGAREARNELRAERVRTIKVHMTMHHMKLDDSFWKQPTQSDNESSTQLFSSDASDFDSPSIAPTEAA